LTCFVLLGLPAGALGVAWPYVRGSFGLPLAALGGLLVPFTASYLLSGATSGHLIGRLGLKPVLVGAVAMFVLGLSLMTISPVWWFLTLGLTVVGLGGGALDAGLNSFAATSGARRLLGLLHGAYSAGGAIGPILVVTVVGLGLSWRGAYGALAAFALVLTVVAGLVGDWRLPSWQVAETSSGRRPTLPGSVWPALVLFLATFFVYVGTGVSAAQWVYSFLIAGHQANVPLAAAAVSGFWWGQTLVRAASGFISVRLGPYRLIDVSLGVALVGAAVLWWSPSDVVRFAAAVLLGSGLGPLFPTLISLAPTLFGRRAVEAVGYQIAAAAVGGAVVAALTGLVLQQWGLSLLPATLFAGVAATLVLHHAGLWLARDLAVPDEERLSSNPDVKEAT
jgi:fucose permease